MPSSRGSSQPRNQTGLLHCSQILNCLSHQGSPRILEWVAIPSSRGFSPSRDQTHVLQFLHWQERSLPLEPPGKPHHFMANRWEKWQQGQTIFLGSKITADGYCSHEIKRCLLLGRKAMTNLDIVLKSRDITLPTKGHIIKAMVFPVVM